MIPEVTTNLTEVELEVSPSLTYGVDFEAGRMTDNIDNLDAVKQAVRKILSTERYAYVIYSSQYGIQLLQLIGQDYDYIVTALRKIIEDAISIDDRITGIEDYTATPIDANSVSVSFTVTSIYGNFGYTTEVNF